MEKKNRLNIPIILFFSVFIITLLAYSNSFNVPFQFDDDLYITRESATRNIETFSSFSHWKNINTRPLSSLTLAINYELGGEKVQPYHWVNLFFHLMGGMVLWLLSGSIFNLMKIEPKKQRIYIPFMVGLFLLHPIQTQAVTYVIQRMTSMAALFFMLSVWLYLKARVGLEGRKSVGKSIVILFFAVIAGGAGVLSKQNAAVFPLVWLALELFFIRNSKGRVNFIWIGILATGILAAGIIGSRFIYNASDMGEITPIMYFATQLRVLPSYIRMFILPLGLSIDHSFRVSEGLLEPGVIAGALFLIGLLIVAALSIKKRPLVTLGILWFFIAHLVESSIIPIADVKVDHRMYLPIVGLVMALVGFVETIDKVSLKRLQQGVVVILVGLSVLTFQRNKVWQSNVSLWENVVDQYPESGRGWMALAKSQMKEKQLDEAIKNFDKAIKAFI